MSYENHTLSPVLEGDTVTSDGSCFKHVWDHISMVLSLSLYSFSYGIDFQPWPVFPSVSLISQLELYINLQMNNSKSVEQLRLLGKLKIQWLLACVLCIRNPRTGTNDMCSPFAMCLDPSETNVSVDSSKEQEAWNAGHCHLTGGKKATRVIIRFWGSSITFGICPNHKPDYSQLHFLKLGMEANEGKVHLGELGWGVVPLGSSANLLEDLKFPALTFMHLNSFNFSEFRFPHL